MSAMHRSLAVVLLGCLCAAAAPAQEYHYPPGKVRGTVFNDQGKLVAGARVEVMPFGRPMGMAVPWAATDNDGRFLIEHLELEEYVVSAGKEDEGYANTAWSFYSKGMPLHRVTLTAAAPEAETSIAFGPKAGVVTGKVVDAATGQPLPAAIGLSRIDDPNVWIGLGGTPEYRVLIPSNVAVGIVFQEDGYQDWRPDKPLLLAPDEKIVMNVSLHGIWPLVDLVANPPNPGKQRMVTKIAAEGSAQKPAQVAKLPLEIRVEIVTQNQDHPSEMIAQVRVKNTGTETYRLPIGRDGDPALKPTNRGRHEFWFSLNSRYEREPLLPGQATFGSTDLPDSFLTIQPNATVRVRFKVDVSRLIPVWKKRGAAFAPFDATCVDLSYDDNPQQYLVRQPSPEAASANGMVVSLKPPAPR
jgi:hypothetical protein